MKKQLENMSDFIDIKDDSEYFVIPNPIYDVVFKYLMEDLESAKIVLSTLINEKIIHLKFEPLSYTHKIEDPDTQKVIHLFHLDFKATIELPNGGQEVIMIELQKAKLPSDIFRFKRYITNNFQEKQIVEVIDPATKAITTINKPIRLIPIFILNFRIENEINDLLIKTSRSKIGLFTQKSLQKKNEFIDNLTYDIWVIQLPNLARIEPKDYEGDDYKTKLFTLLKLFDQTAQMPNRHRLLLIRKLFPNYLDRIIMRLKSADGNHPSLEEKMYMEDEYLTELENRSNKISYLSALAEKRQELLETERKKNKQSQLKLETERKKNEQSQQIILQLAKTLKANGTTIEMIMQMTQLSKESIEAL